MDLYLNDGKITDDYGREIPREELNRMLGDTSGGQQFAKTPKGYMIVDETVKTLVPGAYQLMLTRWGDLFYVPYQLQAEPALALPDTAVGDVFTEIERFWKIDDFFKNRKYTRKRGILLYGPPGTGKTSCLNRLTDFMKEKGGVVFYPMDVNAMKAGLKAFREVEKERPILCVLEDVEIFVRQNEELLTAILDGQESISNVVYLATTNYLKNLPERIRNRPSRFDLVRRVGFPSPAAREMFLTAKTEMDKATIAMWVEKTEGLSFAHLKELDIAVNGFAYPFDVSLKRVRNMKGLVKAEDDLEAELDSTLENDDD